MVILMSQTGSSSEVTNFKPIKFLKELGLDQELITKYQEGTIDPLTFIKTVGHKKILKGLKEEKINYLEFLLLFGANPNLIREFNYAELSELADTTLSLPKNLLFDIPINPDFDHDNFDITNKESQIAGDPHLYDSRISIGATYLKFFSQRSEIIDNKIRHYFKQNMYFLEDENIVRVVIYSITDKIYDQEITSYAPCDYGFDVDFLTEVINKNGEIISSIDRQIKIPKNVPHKAASRLFVDLNRDKYTFDMWHHRLAKYVEDGIINRDDITITAGKGNLAKK